MPWFAAHCLMLEWVPVKGVVRRKGDQRDPPQAGLQGAGESVSRRLADGMVPLIRSASEDAWPMAVFGRIDRVPICGRSSITFGFLTLLVLMVRIVP